MSYDSLLESCFKALCNVLGVKEPECYEEVVQDAKCLEAKRQELQALQ